MSRKHTINPEVTSILGNTQRTDTHDSKAQGESAYKQTWWERMKSGAKKIFGFAKQAVAYIKDEIVPIVLAAASVMNAWSKYQNRTGDTRYAV